MNGLHDHDGILLLTQEKIIEYGKPVKFRINISSKIYRVESAFNLYVAGYAGIDIRVRNRQVIEQFSKTYAVQIHDKFRRKFVVRKIYGPAQLNGPVCY